MTGTLCCFWDHGRVLWLSTLVPISRSRFVPVSRAKMWRSCFSNLWPHCSSYRECVADAAAYSGLGSNCHLQWSRTFTSVTIEALPCRLLPDLGILWLCRWQNPDFAEIQSSRRCRSLDELLGHLYDHGGHSSLATKLLDISAWLSRFCCRP
jgi:hypothetical protein